MDSQVALRCILETVSEPALFVASLGRTAELLYRLRPDTTLFLDSLGDVSSVATGLAIATRGKARVISVDTDGSQLFRLTLLHTIATRPMMVDNLLIVVLDNGLLESAGGLDSGSKSVRWESLGRAFGLKIETVRTRSSLQASLKKWDKGLKYLRVVVANPSAEVTTKSIDGIESRYRFARAVEKALGKPVMRPCTKN